MGGVHLVIPTTAIGSVSSSSDQAIAHRSRSLPRVRRHRASSINQEGSSSNGSPLVRYYTGPISMRLSFPTPSILMCNGHNICDTEIIGECGCEKRGAHQLVYGDTQKVSTRYWNYLEDCYSPCCAGGLLTLGSERHRYAIAW